MSFNEIVGLVLGYGISAIVFALTVRQMNAVTAAELGYESEVPETRRTAIRKAA